MVLISFSCVKQEEPAMTVNPKQEQRHVDHYLTERKEKRDISDGFDRGYDTPYPKSKEELILANIEKVSPAFVKGYRQGRLRSFAEEYSGREYDDQEY